LAHLGRIAALANSPRRDRGATRAIYSYPAKFQAHLPAELIQLFTRPGDLVVDPYAGGGTTGLEACLAGRAFVGVDLSPFACVLGRVKTTPVAADAAHAALDRVLAGSARRPVLDADDELCLGPAIADELARLAAGLDGLAEGPPRDLLRVALIHAVKIAGRRDFTGASLIPLFRRRVGTILAGLAELPAAGPRPRFRTGSSAALPEVDDGAARLVVTSPPYKDLDVEYGLIQIQRRHLRKSKRSQVIWALLGVPPLPKAELCGGRGASYWARLGPALREIRRVLAPGAPAFFWIGFKTPDDREAFVAALDAAGLAPAELVPVGLSADRVASSRSTHHGRATGMLAEDFLIVCA
jgi:hypothetical protein